MLDYEIDAQRRLVTLTFTGPVSEEDVGDARDRVTGDPAFRPEYAWLVDALGADVRTLSAPLLRKRATRPPTRAAMAIVVSTDLGYGLARMYETLSAGRVAVFRAREPALEWLRAVHRVPSPGLPPADDPTSTD